MKNIVLYSPPAAGKGTLCEFLKSEYGYEVLSIGQVLRNNRSMDTEVGRKIIETQDKGILTPDPIVAEALKNELKKFEGKNIVIEGYPRNINQAKMLDTIFDNYVVINLAVSRKVAMERTLGRVSCKKCGKIYDIFNDSMKPKIENICDVCGETLEIRSDDNENSFNVRYDIYEQNSPSILDFYESKGILNIVNAENSKEIIANDVKNVLGE